jgi:D-glycero-D-manno-heptose 1,7-bisphosphate phosphatase
MNLRKLLDEDIDVAALQTIPNFGSAYTKPVIGISRDGVINYAKTTHVTRPDEFEIIPGAAAAVAEIRRKGYRIIILSNQYGISEGRMTPVEVDMVNQRMLELFGEAGCPSIDAMYYSTSRMKEDMFALPNIGMFHRAEREHPVKFKEGWFVGDKISDLKAAENIKAKPVLIKTGEWAETSKKLDTYANRDLRKRTQIFDNLMAFADSLSC